MAARFSQFAATFAAPMLRNRADAALAIAEVIDRKELLVQPKHAMETLSDEDAVWLQRAGGGLIFR